MDQIQDLLLNRLSLKEPSDGQTLQVKLPKAMTYVVHRYISKTFDSNMLSIFYFN